ncbi:hypothetical protein [Streptomyces sp. NBC_01217]|uniref:hypothetical protein n=1 Tax=Streptomyces sp. NBC_01217 TaxID=2903779 RepID=UPI002E0DAFC4|nr:hypothetical protein OG507_01550 [Streptomyces sp. NBC_01217]
MAILTTHTFAVDLDNIQAGALKSCSGLSYGQDVIEIVSCERRTANGERRTANGERRTPDVVAQLPGLTRRHSRWTEERLRSTPTEVGLVLAGRGRRPDGAGLRSDPTVAQCHRLSAWGRC